MAHTPGPWRVGPINYADVYGANGEIVALVPKGFEETVDNARLIAAAPELLEALKQMIDSAYPHPVEHPTMTAAWKVAKAAVAKAEGR